jgi:hypothetical protein
MHVIFIQVVPGSCVGQEPFLLFEASFHENISTVSSNSPRLYIAVSLVVNIFTMSEVEARS